MLETLENLIKALVNHPAEVIITERQEGRNLRYEVKLNSEDYGKLIGREGRTIKAIRSLLYIAGQKQGRRFFLELFEE
jgi:predicted RNA-binding protein YlqC (UPF0109 family)